MLEWRKGEETMIRFARKEDAPEIAPLILVILKDMELPFLKQTGEQKTLEILEEAITDPNYRYVIHEVS